MGREIEKATHAILADLYATAIDTPAWLQRRGRHECRRQWPLVQNIYRALTGRLLPEIMPPRERRKVDGVFRGPSGQSFIFELDEKQHFNEFRATTLRLYPATIRLGFSRDWWIKRSEQERKLEGGGFAKPKPPLFPDVNGRHPQRAFRDALADILPHEHGFAPTLRLADIEIRDWIDEPGAMDRMARLVIARIDPMAP